MTTCPHCGQLLPPDVPPGLTGKRLRLYEMVKKAGPRGVPTDVLFDMLYGHLPNGGPDGGLNSLASRISLMNRYKLRPHGQEISAQHGPGGPHNYVLRKYDPR